ncbi:MAG: ATP-binding protein, partial [Chloroflexi bacterium]|nr:ATP-binding protein [Chloroflexota bacterium]
TARYVEDAQSVVRELAQRSSIRQAIFDDAPERVQSQLAQLLAANDRLDTISIADVRGIVRASAVANAPTLGSSSADRDWFQQAMSTGGPYLGVPALSRTTGHPNAPYGVPVLDDQLRVRGVVAGGISLDALSKAITGIQIGPGARASLVDRRAGGIVLAHVYPQRSLGPVSGVNEATRRLLAGERGAAETINSSGEADLAAYTSAPGLPWGVLILRPRDAALAPVDALAAQAVRWGAGGVLLVVLLGWGLALRFTGALSRLQHATAAFTAGDLTQRLRFTRRDEVGDLARAFDAMAEALAERTAQTAAANAELQEQVQVRQRAEEVLHRTLANLEQQYHATDYARAQGDAVLNATREAIALVAPDRRFLTVNRSLVEFFGVLPEQVLGKSFVNPELQIQIERIFSDPEVLRSLVVGSAADQEREFRGSLTTKWPDRRELELFSKPVRSPAGEHLGRLYVFRDVTHEREVDRMKTEFVALVSHELRTPLTSIKGYVDLLADGSVGELTGEQQEFLGIVKSNSNRLLALINELLDISRIESGKIELLQEPLDLVLHIRSVAAMLEPQIAAKNQRLHLELPPHLPPALGDPARVTQILANLLSNANKYTPAGGGITVMVQRQGQMLLTAVQDTGIGMTPVEQAQLFTKFFRAINRTTQEVSGTGLGLAITRSLVDMHGGELRVQSAPGQGSTFSFTLPQAGAAIFGETPPDAGDEAAAYDTVD